MKINRFTLFVAGIICINANSANAQKATLVTTTKPLAHNANLGEQVNFFKAKTEKIIAQNKKSTNKFAKVTATDSRLIGIAQRDLRGAMPIVIDSSKYYYNSTNRGGDLTSENIKFDSLLTKAYDASAAALINNTFYGQSFDAMDNLVYRLEKTWDNLPMAYDNNNQSYFTNNATGKLVIDSNQFWDAGIWNNNTKRIVTYNASDLVLQDSIFEWAATAWDKYLVSAYTYNVAGKITNIDYSVSYLGIWLNALNAKLTYDASGFLTEVLIKSLGGSMTLENNSRNLFTNDAAGNAVIDKYESWDGGAWINVSNTYNKYNTANKVTESIIENWDDLASKYDTTSRSSYSYNSFNQLEIEVADSFIAASSTWLARDSNNYYYENYTPTKIENSSVLAGLRIYPNPSTNKITIEGNLESNLDAQLSLMDMQGRIVYTATADLNKNMRHTIDISTLANGTYLLQLKNNNGLNEVTKVTIAH